MTAASMERLAPADLDQDAVYEEALTTLETAVKVIGKNVCDELYGALLDTIQDYLKDNVRFNIASALATAERSRRDAWLVAHDLGDVLLTLRDYVSDASKGLTAADSEGIRKMAREDLARVDAALAVVRATPKPYVARTAASDKRGGDEAEGEVRQKPQPIQEGVKP